MDKAPMTAEERYAILSRATSKALRELEECKREMQWLRDKLVEAQERNRKLDIILTAALEGKCVR